MRNVINILVGVLVLSLLIGPAVAGVVMMLFVSPWCLFVMIGEIVTIPAAVKFVEAYVNWSEE